MKHIKLFDKINENRYADANLNSFETYKKSINNLIDYLKENDIETDAKKFLEKNMDKRCRPFFILGANRIDQIIDEFKRLKK